MKELMSIFPRWAEAMAHYLKAIPHLYDKQSHYPKSDISIHEMLNEMVTFFILHCEFRDKFFNDFGIPIGPWGQSVRFHCNRIDSDFTFGFDYQGFFFSTDIRYPEHLKRMDDEFWSVVS